MDKALAQKLVNRFNAAFPVGSTVQLRMVSQEGYPYNPYQVRSLAYVSFGGDPVAFFEGISGHFCVEPQFVQYPEQEGGEQA